MEKIFHTNKPIELKKKKKVIVISHSLLFNDLNYTRYLLVVFDPLEFVDFN